MNADSLLALYDRVAEAPDAIGRLRRFVLDLAARGKLVQQDPSDEPASALLQRITKEKIRLARKRSTTRAMANNTGPANQVPFNLPHGWVETTIGGICSKTGSGSTPRGGKNAYTPSGIVFLRSQNVHNDGLRLTDVAYIDQATHERMSVTTVKASDLLLNITGGSIGRCCLVPDDLGQANVSQHVAIIRTAIDGPQRFLHCVILSPFFQAFIFREQTGAGRGGLPKYKMDRIPVALPPMAEQHRIVTKVDEFMTLCDRLEQTRTSRDKTHDRLTKASLARLSTPDANTALFCSHAHFTVDSIPVLTARADQVKHLRQTILNLAVHGKLVKQNPEDEPASELLKRIAAEKARLVRAGEIKLRKLKSRDRQDSHEFVTPNGWQLADLGSIALKITDGAHKTPTYVDDGVPFVSVKDFSAGCLELSHTRFIPPSEHKSLYKRCDPRRGDILLGRIGTLGKAVLVDTDVEFSLYVSVGLIRFDHKNIDPVYLQLILNSPFVEKEFERIKIGGGTHTNKLNLGDLHTVALPLAPLSEQSRIVTKIDELITLCDRLEAGLNALDTHRNHLLESVLHEALRDVA